ncbi:SERHL2 (predicted) [Pycnogonum litorale]
MRQFSHHVLTNLCKRFFYSEKRIRRISSKVTSSGMSDVHELCIPVPWGQVAARDWGNEEGHPVFALHGWQDNAGSFDTLIPSINKSLNLRIIAVDFPGHGFSSHMPPGFLYGFMDLVALVKRMINHFGFKSVSLMGHSLGAGVSSIFASLYPELVRKALFFDFVKPVSIPLDTLPFMTKGAIDGLLELESKLTLQQSPVYSRQEALDRLLKSSVSELTEETAKILLKRGVKPSSKDGSGVEYTRDLRLRVPSIVSYSAEQHKEYLKRLQCPLLVIKASDFDGWEDQSLINATVAMYRRNCKYFKYLEVPGGHHFHLNHPHLINDAVNEFFEHAVDGSKDKVDA